MITLCIRYVIDQNKYRNFNGNREPRRSAGNRDWYGYGTRCRKDRSSLRMQPDFSIIATFAVAAGSAISAARYFS